MSADDDYFNDDDEDEGSGEALSRDGSEAAAAGADQSFGQRLRIWLSVKRGWLLIVGLAVAQALFATIVITMREDAKPVAEVSMAEVRALAVDMLGHEVGIKNVYQSLPIRGGKRLSIGMDLVLVLGQLPEEQVAGAPRPNNEEFALFIAAINELEPRIRSQINLLVRRMPPEELGTVESYKRIKEEIKKEINDALESLNFGKGLRPGIGKRRVTEVLIPMFLRQYG